MSFVFDSLTAADLRLVFHGRVWVYECSACRQFFLKPTAGMVVWRDNVARQQGTLLARTVAALPESQSRRGICIACSCQGQRSRRESVSTGAPPAAAQASASSGEPPATPRPVSPRLIGVVNVVHDVLEPLRRPPAPLSVTPMNAVIRPPCVLLEPPDDAPHAPPPASAVPTCKEFLDALLADQFRGAEDQAFLGRIASAVLLRGFPDVLRLTRGNGTTSVYMRGGSPRKVRVKKSKANKRRAASRKEFGAMCPAETLSPIQ